MSKRAEALVWERSRAGKSDLLALVKIADLADDEGRNAWPEIPALARWLRATGRGVNYILHRLVRAGELSIELNDGGRYIELKGGRRFRPKWFLHVRCVCEWEAYQTGAGPPGELEKIADSCLIDPPPFPRGRPSRKSEKISNSAVYRNGKTFPRNVNARSSELEKTRTAYKEDPLVDPLVELRAGASPPPASAKPPEQARDNIRVITKLAHEGLDLVGDCPILMETVKTMCARRGILYDSGTVRAAVDSAIWQRRHRQREG